MAVSVINENDVQIERGKGIGWIKGVDNRITHEVVICIDNSGKGVIALAPEP